MARKVRVEYPGVIYHVMNRGNRREPIFKDDEDRSRFLATLGQACSKTDWQVHTGRFNRRHKLFGHLFGGRCKTLIVDGSGSGYLKTVCDYVHLNPARAKLLMPEAPLRSYRWSSWPEYLKSPGKRWPWLRVDRFLGEYRIPRDSTAGRRQLERELEARRQGEAGADYRELRRGWCLGEESFRKELLEEMAGRVGAEHYGEERAETEQARAERMVRGELKRRKWREGIWPNERKTTWSR